jgi:prevent-host-death family protein
VVGWLSHVGEPINMHEAKSDLSRLVERALTGEDVVIARAGKPVVRLVPVAVPGKRNLGIWRGKVRMADDFDAPMSEQELADWEGR